ncbi:MAG TPA: DinB family protein [Propionibacteriaceae bacterium]|nr:DinB family protein [Propionibacteriaceae bacterium]
MNVEPGPGTAEPVVPEPDAKDWTFVITGGCPECGFAPFDPAETATRLRASIPRWGQVLARPGVRTRPQPGVWSALEYGCHVRDVCELFARRLRAMLDADPAEGARFADWDQDATALEKRYWEDDPTRVADDYARLAERLAGQWDAVGGDQWQRHGLRSNGSQFTVATLGVYLIHDIEHHLHDVGA